LEVWGKEEEELDLEELLDAGRDLQYVTIMGMSPLAYCCSLCDEELAIRVACEGRGVNLNETGTTAGSYTALHYAADFSLCDLAAELLRLGVDLQAKTEDMPVPGGGAVSGGRTALHLAASKGDEKMVKLLVDGGAFTNALDYDGNTPLLLAAMEDRAAIVMLLTSAVQDSGSTVVPIDKPALQARKGLANKQAKQRMAVGAHPEAKFREVYVLRQVWSVKERAQVLEVVNRVANKSGWQTNRHAAYATTDMRCSDLPMAAAVWVRRTISERLFPAMLQQYKLHHHRLSFRDLFFVYYKVRTSYLP
jgi:ankyrin repeat protein